MSSRAVRLLFLTLFIAATGCASDLPPLPKYPIEPVDITVATIRDRSPTLARVTGQGEVTLTSHERGSVRLDAAFVLQPPDFARIRAWKFNQAVFDLTATPDGTWLYSPRDDAAAGDGNVGTGIREWLGYLRSGVPASAVVASKQTDGEIVVTSHDDHSGGTLTTTIDRPTRTVQNYRLVDATGVERFTLTLDRYRIFGATLWPTRIVAKSQAGTMMLETRDLQPGVVAPTAFTPPARAKRLP